MYGGDVMKKASYIVGLIGSIIGIISCSILLFSGLNMLVTNPQTNYVIALSIVGLLLSILALVGVCINNKKILTGIFILIGALANIPCVLFSIGADNPMTFIACAIAAIMLIIAGIMRLVVKE